jgi:hypothetical protein
MIQNKRQIFVSKEKETNTIKELGWDNRFFLENNNIKPERPGTHNSKNK